MEGSLNPFRKQLKRRFAFCQEHGTGECPDGCTRNFFDDPSLGVDNGADPVIGGADHISTIF